MPKLIKKYLPVMLITTVIAFFMLQHFANKEIPSDETLVIGLSSQYPPFEFINSEGDVIGFDVDLAKYISEKLQKKLIIKNSDFEGLILSLKQGKIDLIMSGMNITPSRLKEIIMVPYYGNEATSLSLIFWGVIPDGIKTLEDISKTANPTISVQSGSIPQEYMKYFPEINTKAMHGGLEPLIDVKYGKSLANLVEPDVADYLKKQYPQIKTLKVILKPDTKILGFGIGINQENKNLANEVAKIIAELKDSGELKKLEEKWFYNKETK